MKKNRYCLFLGLLVLLFCLGLVVFRVGSHGYKKLVHAQTCIPNCSGKECGDDGCGGVCGFCNSGKTSGLVCNDNYRCVSPANDELSMGNYRKSYQEMLEMYGNLNRLQVTSDKVVLQEFVSSSGDVYAGHLGGFYALPYFSAVRETTKMSEAFNIGLGFSNGYYRVWEQPSLLSEGKWYPSKLVLSKDYPGGGGGHIITGTKFGLPNARAFALKINVAYYHPSQSDDMGILFFVNIPRIGKISGLEGTWFKSGCEVLGKCSSAGKTYRNGSSQNEFYYYDGSTKICLPFKVITNKPGTFTFRIEDHTELGHSRIVNDFKETGNVGLNNSDADLPERDGSKVGIHFQPSIEEANTNYDIALVAVVGEANTASQCQQKVVEWLGGYNVDEIERLADDAFNQKLTSLYDTFPKFQSSNYDFLNKIYLNSFLHLPFTTFKKDSQTVGANNNGYESLNFKNTYIQMIPFFGQCGGMYPWSTARFSYAWALADPEGLKEEIIKYLALDWQKHRAYDNILGNHRGDNIEYSFNYWAMTKLIYDYITTTSDFGFLDEVHSGVYGRRSIFDYLVQITDLPENIHNRQGQLVDFGSDKNLWEYDIHCDQGGKLTGYVFSPNAERYIQNKMLADIYRQRENYNQSNQRSEKADLIKEDIFNKLWDPGVGTFNSDFPVPMSLHTLDFDGFWKGREEEKSSLINFAFNNPNTHFIGPYGFTSLPFNWDKTCYVQGNCGENENHWCSRQDWHGPGLYSGEVMHILKGLFKEGFKEKAMTMLNKYSYLQNAPFWGEALPYKSPSFDGAGYIAMSYMDGGFGFTEVIIQGLFGVSTDTYVTTIYPHIPVGFGETFLTDLNVQTHKFDIYINRDDTVHQLDMCVGCGRVANGDFADRARIRYGTESKKKVVFAFRNLQDGIYAIKIDNKIVATKVANNGFLAYTSNDWQGVHLLNLETINCQDNDGICPATCSSENDNDCVIRGDLDYDGDIDGNDIKILLSRYLTNDSKTDHNDDGIVNGVDYEKMIELIQ